MGEMATTAIDASIYFAVNLHVGRRFVVCVKILILRWEIRIDVRQFVINAYRQLVHGGWSVASRHRKKPTSNTLFMESRGIQNFCRTFTC